MTTRLVQVDVVVTDKEGQPVEGLTKDDFIRKSEELMSDMYAASRVQRPLAATVYRLKVVARDATSGATGSVEIPMGK